MLPKTNAVFAVALFCAWSFATTVDPRDIDEQLSSAVLVADVEIESLESFSDPRFHARSIATARVLKIRTLRNDGGWFPGVGDAVEIETLGGEVGDQGVLYSGYPRPRVGHKYHASFRRTGATLFATTGFSKGLLPFSPERGYSRNRTDGSNGSGAGPFLYWDPTYFPIPYFVNQASFFNHPEMLDAIDLSFKQWRDPANVAIEFLPMGCTSTNTNRNDGINAIILVKENWQFDAAAIAVTRNFYVSGSGARAGMILDTDIMINNVDHEFSTTGDVTKNDVRNILTHEVGHLVGLGHEVPAKDLGASMYEVAVVGETQKRTLHANDLAALREGYGGVGQKFSWLSTQAACSVSSQALSCLSVPQSQPKTSTYLWLVMAIGLALCLGSVYSAWSIRRQ